MSSPRDRSAAGWYVAVGAPPLDHVTLADLGVETFFFFFFFPSPVPHQSILIFPMQGRTSAVGELRCTDRRQRLVSDSRRSVA